jgi:hypothetical protein
MHNTLLEDVLGYIQEYTIKDEEMHIVGWCFHKIKGILPIRLNYNNTALYENFSNILKLELRPDVYRGSYNGNNILNCGWIVDVKQPELIEIFRLEMEIDGEWKTVFDFLFYETNVSNIPSFIVVDNFYKHPYQIRDFALQQNFQEHPKYHKGKRTETVYRFPNLKSRFENILGCKIKKWEEYGVNCCFQSCIAGEQLVYHTDIQQYAGIIFLTPDAPPETGTTFYRSKNTKNMKVNGDYNNVFKTGVLDQSQFDVVDVVGNKFNRLVLFDAQMIHAASSYFGNNLYNGRLFQLFFFDLEIKN